MAIQILQPKAELIIETAIRIDGTIAQLLYIWTITPDAYEWVQQEAVRFGELSTGNSIYTNGKRTLFVHPAYDPLEVKAYLESMGVEDTPQGTEE